MYIWIPRCERPDPKVARIPAFPAKPSHCGANLVDINEAILLCLANVPSSNPNIDTKAVHGFSAWTLRFLISVQRTGGGNAATLEKDSGFPEFLRETCILPPLLAPSDILLTSNQRPKHEAITRFWAVSPVTIELSWVP